VHRLLLIQVFILSSAADADQDDNEEKDDAPSDPNEDVKAILVIFCHLACIARLKDFVSGASTDWLLRTGNVLQHKA